MPTQQPHQPVGVAVEFRKAAVAEPADDGRVIRQPGCLVGDGHSGGCRLREFARGHEAFSPDEGDCKRLEIEDQHPTQHVQAEEGDGTRDARQTRGDPASLTQPMYGIGERQIQPSLQIA
jgi:hypothetical protein